MTSRNKSKRGGSANAVQSQSPSAGNAPNRLFLFGGIACLIVVPALLAASQLELDSDHTRRRRIEQMTVVERERLKHNFETFQRLPRDRRQRYRQLHAAIAGDAGLQKTMTNFADWLKTLSPWQRDELRKETDPIKRLDLVHFFKQKQDSKREQQSTPFAGSVTPALGRFMAGGPKLKQHDLEAVLKVVEQSLPIPAAARGELEALRGVERHIRVVETAMKTAGKPGPFGRSRWPEPELLDEMIAAMSDDHIRKSLRANGQPDRMRQGMVFMLIKGVGAEVQAEMASKQPTEGELKEFFTQLEGQDRDEIMRLPPDQAKQRLRWKYFAQNRDGLPRAAYEFRRLMQRLMPRGGMRPPGGDNPKFEGGGQRRPPFDGKKRVDGKKRDPKEREPQFEGGGRGRPRDFDGERPKPRRDRDQ